MFSICSNIILIKIKEWCDIHKILELDEVKIPYVVDGGINYYPTKYMLEQFLLRSNFQFHKNKSYEGYLKKCVIDFSIKGTTEQECYCMNKEGWINYLNSCRKHKNKTKDKIDRMNHLLRYFGQDIISFYDSKQYDEYTLSCIEGFKESFTDFSYKECIVCGRNLPDSDYFFNKDDRRENGIVNTCRQCNNGEFLNDDTQNKYIYDTFGLDGFKAYKNGELDFYVKHILSNNNNKIKLPENNKDFLLKLIKQLYDCRFLTKEQLNQTVIRNKIKNINFHKCFTEINSNEINEFCSDNDCKYKPWLYSNYRLGKISYEYGNLIFKNYISENNIVIDNIFTYKDYYRLLRECGLNQFGGNILYFVVQFYQFKYPGYKFKIASVNYYKDVEMRKFDFKWLVEKDCKVEIDKIPLYITKYTISQKSSSMYRVVSYYYKNLFELVNECYPDKFIENDFVLNPYRSVFDSLEEAQIHEVLKNNLNNVIHNSRNTENTINIMGMIPDWLIITNKGCYLVEYFGLFSERAGVSHRLLRYEKNLKIKIDKYKELEKYGYKSLHIYPNDLKDNFKSLLEKINNIN